MKIPDSMKTAPTVGVSGQTQVRSGKSSESVPVRSSAPDSVRISPQLQALSGQLAETGVFDSKKVAEIKAAIASGKFQVNAEKIADGLMDTVKNLIQTRKG